MIWSALFADKVEYVNKGVPILPGKHITSGKIDYKDVRYLDKEKYEPIYYPKYVPKANDILLANDKWCMFLQEQISSLP